jgi:hypothetical protein
MGWVVSITPQLLFTPGTPWIGGWVDLRADMDTRGWRKTFTSSGDRTPVVQSVVSIVTELLQLPLKSNAHLTWDMMPWTFDSSSAGQCIACFYGTRRFISVCKKAVHLTMLIVEYRPHLSHHISVIHFNILPVSSRSINRPTFWKNSRDGWLRT